MVSARGQVLRTVDQDQYKEAMSCLPAPIAIVTCWYRDRPWGLTASSVTALSLTPPLVSVSIARTASCHEALTRSDEFLISVLTARHRDLASRFATSGAAMRYRCARTDVLPVGDHDLLVGLVTEMSVPGLSRTWSMIR